MPKTTYCDNILTAEKSAHNILSCALGYYWHVKYYRRKENNKIHEKRGKRMYKKATEKRTAKRVAGTVDFQTVEVKNARECRNGNIAFTLVADGLTFYDLFLVKNKAGEWFISTPTKKGTDGNYYHYYYLNLTDECSDRIIDLVVGDELPE